MFDTMTYLISRCSLRGRSANDPIINNKQLGKQNVKANLGAGTYILERFQSSWSELHEAAQDNAAKAQVYIWSFLKSK